MPAPAPAPNPRAARRGLRKMPIATVSAFQSDRMRTASDGLRRWPATWRAPTRAPSLWRALTPWRQHRLSLNGFGSGANCSLVRNITANTSGRPGQCSQPTSPRVLKGARQYCQISSPRYTRSIATSSARWRDATTPLSRLTLPAFSNACNGVPLRLVQSTGHCGGGQAAPPLPLLRPFNFMAMRQG